jgi:hypothetical protein
MIGIRYTNSPDQRFFNPDRDIGHLIPKLLSKLFGKTENLSRLKNDYPWLSRVFQNKDVSSDDFVKLAMAVGQYVVLSLKDINCRSPKEAMVKAGLASVSDEAFVMLMAMLGFTILELFFVAIREKYSIGERPLFMKEYLDMLLSGEEKIAHDQFAKTISS